MKHIEIMAPVGSYEALSAAIQAGSGSVYFGVGKLNMRSRSTKNFSLDDLKEISSICREHAINSYVTINTIIYDDEMEAMRQLVDACVEYGITAVIASDQAVIQYARSRSMEVHMSTQTNITNIEAVRYYAQYADVMVTARELSLDQVAVITQAIKDEQIIGPSGELIRIEIFVHGALCMAVSGKCYLSLDLLNSSANRGACLQPCRRAYQVKDKDEEVEMVVENEFIMSPKDLNTIAFLDKILASGVEVLKIEGRGRSPEYVKTVTEVYKEAVDAVLHNSYTTQRIEQWNERLKTVYNRGFWDGYYLGQRMGEWAEQYGSVATERKMYVGKIVNFYQTPSIAEIKMETQSLSVGDKILVIGPTTGVYEDRIVEIRVDYKPVHTTQKGEHCSIPATAVLRPGDKVYKMIRTNQS